MIKRYRRILQQRSQHFSRRYVALIAVLTMIVLFAVFPVSEILMQNLRLDEAWVRLTAEPFPSVGDATANESNLTEGLTVVTAYFDLGSFQKGNGGRQFTPDLYRQWAQVFARLESPTVIFVDSEEHRRFFTELRQLHLPSNMTVIQLLDRRQMWAFRLEPYIAKIFSRLFYPHFTPNTVVPSYSAAMHAKYEVMQIAMRSNPFRTQYFCWLDIGLFRGLAGSGDSGSHFSLSIPPQLDVDAVAYTVVTPRIPDLSAKDIIKRDLVWVCGCFFVGRKDALKLWTEEYKAATEKMIEDGWMSTDQQVIYTVYNTMKPRTKLQLYLSDGRSDEWFHLGYVARDAGAKKLDLAHTPQTVVINATVQRPTLFPVSDNDKALA